MKAGAIGAVLAFTGAAAAIAGSFLPWAHVTVVRSALTGSSLSLEPGGWNGDGNVVCVLGVLAALVGALLLWKDAGTVGSLLRTTLLVFGVAVVVVTFWDTTHVAERFSHVGTRVAEEKRVGRAAPRVRTRVAPGIAIAAAGGVAMVFAALVDRLLTDEEVVVVDD